jgi:hypothetical protein
MTDMPDATTTKRPTPSPDDEATNATPEEILAETQPDDPEVGIDGTGMGELP